MSNMTMAIDCEKCDECGECVDVCPVGAIKRGGGCFVIDSDTCVMCDSCLFLCNDKAQAIYYKVTP